MGLFDFKNTLSKVAKGVSDTVSNILEYEMEYDIHPTSSDSYSGYYESFHNYLDTHLNEWSNNKYNIYEMLAIHDVLDEILIYFWEPNFNYKETKIDLRLPEDFGNEYDITIGYLHYLRMLMMLVKNQEEFDFKEVDDAIKDILIFNENSYYTMDGASKEAVNNLLSSIPEITKKYLGKEVVPYLPPKIDEYPDTVRIVVASYNAERSYVNHPNDYNQQFESDRRNDYYAQQAEQEERERRMRYDQEERERRTREEEAIRNRAYWDIQDGLAPQSTSNSYLNAYDDYKDKGY